MVAVCWKCRHGLVGTVTDATGAIVPGATVSIENPVSGYSRVTTTDSSGHYQFTNLPLNPYHVGGFVDGVCVFDSGCAGKVLCAGRGEDHSDYWRDFDGRECYGQRSGGERFDVSHGLWIVGLFDKLPLESQSSSLSSLVTLSSPGVAADSNGLFHGLGDHASNSFSIDGQPITDQQSKVFSNQIPSNSIQSIEVISGAPPAEFGGKTSLVIQVTTRSGLGVKKPTGSVTTSYGSFVWSATGGIDLSYGGEKWGNFV